MQTTAALADKYADIYIASLYPERCVSKARAELVAFARGCFRQGFIDWMVGDGQSVSDRNRHYVAGWRAFEPSV